MHVRLSYLEIYNESIRDLLSPLPTPAGQGLMLREDAAKKISVVGITEHIPESPERVLEMIQEGNLRRTMSPTEANAVSSRSHAVLQINVTQRPRTADTITETTSASLNIIDLAGSERAAATRNNGVRMKEGANINKSLLALGNCINALCQSGGQRSRHVPYRNSKLTRLLKFSLGGNCKTVMIVCVSPSSAHYDETHNTLKYANQAKNIRTKVSRNMLNVDRHVAQYVQAIHELKEEVVELKAKLAERGALESAVEKKRRADIISEMSEAKTKMRESTEHVKRIVSENAGLEVHLAAAGARLALLREQLGQGTGDDDHILTQMAAREEATLRDERISAAIRLLNNSLQMQRGIIVAASQNTKFDAEATEAMRTSGECMLAEVEALRSHVKYESLKAVFDRGTAHFAKLVSTGTQSTVALQQAALQAQSLSAPECEPFSPNLALLAEQLSSICAANNEMFSGFDGISVPMACMNEPSALRRARGSSVSVAGTHNKALLPIKSPRKLGSRRSSTGPRRSGIHARRNPGRSFSTSTAPGRKKSFRWADEAGEGDIDDHNRRSASPPHVRHAPTEMRPPHPVLPWKARLSTVRPGETDASQSSSTEWEDVSREGRRAATTPLMVRNKREGMFERNFLVKKAAKSSRLGEEPDSSVSDDMRAPLSELSNGFSDASSNDDNPQHDKSDYTPDSVRSSPYRRRSSQLGPVRRKARSSLGETATQAAKAGPLPRLATGPPLFTASRSARVSQINASSAATTAHHNTTSIPTTAHPPDRSTPPNAVVHRSSSGTAWR